MAEVPPDASGGEPVDEASNETTQDEGTQVEQGGSGGGQSQPEEPARAEWWHVDPEPPTIATQQTPPSGTPPSGPPPYATPPFGTPPPYGAPQFGTPQFGTPPPYGGPQFGAPPPYGPPPYAAPQFGTPPPYGAPPPGTPPYGAPTWSMPGWGAPPWAGGAQWYGWGPGSPGGPAQPQSGSSSPTPPRRRPIPWVIIGAVLAAIAMIALGVGIGFSVWGGSTAAVARQRVTVPSPRISPTTGIRRGFPFTGTGRGGFLGVEIATTSSVTTSSGAHVESVVPSSPAAKAGIVKGDTITEFDTKSVTSAAALATAVARISPGTRVKVGWVTSAGKHESATVTLASRTAATSLG